MERTRIAVALTTIVLLAGACNSVENPGRLRAQGHAGKDREVTIARTLPCEKVAPIAAKLIGKVDTTLTRVPGEKFAPMPGARKVAEATYFCGWSNERADVVLRIYPNPLTAEQAQRVWEGRTGQTSAYGGNACIKAPAGFGDASMGVVCTYGTVRSVLQVLGLFGDSLVECWHTRAETKPVEMAAKGMAFCEEVIAAIGKTSTAS